MPSRILREGIIGSSRVNALSFGAEVFYRRLMSVADDHGRFYGSPATLRGACWPTTPERVTEDDVFGWLFECSTGDDPLLFLYEVKGCIYTQITNFRQQTRSASKFPDPPEEGRLSVAKQMQSGCQAPVHAIRSSYSYFVFRTSATSVAAVSVLPSKPEPEPPSEEFALHEQSAQPAKQKPTARHPDPDDPGYDPGKVFEEEFWEQCRWSSHDRLGALNAFKKQCPTRKKAELMIARAKEHGRYWSTVEKKVYMSTWINGRCNDDLTEEIQKIEAEKAKQNSNGNGSGPKQVKAWVDPFEHLEEAS